MQMSGLIKVRDEDCQNRVLKETILIEGIFLIKNSW